MYLVVGLGNPDKIYHNTPHNLGFMCADMFAQKLGVKFSKNECKALTAHARVDGQKVIVAKPLTYMNLSGEAVSALCRKYKVEKGRLVVVYDDIDIPMGKLRIRAQGSARTHNGMKNILLHLGTEDFARVRVGIGKETPLSRIDYVLSQLSPADHDLLDIAIENASDALCDFVKGASPDDLMQKYNNK